LAGEIERLQAEIAALRARIAEAEARADIDPLVGIFNRRGFMRELERAIAYVKRYGGEAALIYFDLDRFKAINDAHGHAAGDAVLQSIATLLLRNVRASDCVGRLGGDEFAILLWNLDAGRAAAKALALETLVAATPVAWGIKRLAVGGSAGCAPLDPRSDAAGLLALADRAMYARKALRRAGAGPA
jgi:diguanylate cyclase (GGDEF)-like protein